MTAMETLRVMSYNVHSGVGNDGAYDLERLAAVIRRSGADIACLQEVEFNSSMRKNRRWSATHADKQPMLLGKATGLKYWSFVGPLAAYMAEDSENSSCLGHEEELIRDHKNEAVYGNAILSKFPILDKRTLLYQGNTPPMSPDRIYMDREEQPRGACAILVDAGESNLSSVSSSSTAVGKAHGGSLSCCMIKRPDGPGAGGAGPRQPVWIINTHLAHRFSTEEQRGQARQLLEWIDTLTSTEERGVKPGYVLCGDLNSTNWMPFSGFSTITGDRHWRDLWHESGTACCQATFPSALGTNACGIRIDHILALQSPRCARIACDDVRILTDPSDAEASDHYALVARLGIQR